MSCPILHIGRYRTKSPVGRYLSKSPVLVDTTPDPLLVDTTPDPLLVDTTPDPLCSYICALYNFNFHTLLQEAGANNSWRERRGGNISCSFFFSV